ncbi:MAG: histidine kinase dimerization/phospho-acceptor domain-containing protein [Dongiaceae bacterium]
MWPYTDTEQSWLTRNARPIEAPLRQPLSPEREAEAHARLRDVGRPADPIPDIVRRHGQERLYLIAEAVAFTLVESISRIGRCFALRRPAARSGATTAPVELREELRQPLTSIRSAAEILRDNPTLAPEQRARMLGVIVSESERLDRLIGAARASA